MIYDCFPFFNELDLLRVRIEELAPVVDRFVLIEAKRTHSGREKPLYFEEHKDEFADFADRIDHYIATDLEPLEVDSEENRYKNENRHRNHVSQALADLGCRHDDIVLIGDVDEIPRASCVTQAIDLLDEKEFVVFLQLCHQFYINNSQDNGQNRHMWTGTVAIRATALEDHTPDEVRRGNWRAADVDDGRRNPECAYIDNAGWHLCSMGGPKALTYKVQSFVHAQFDTGNPRIERDDCRSGYHNTVEGRRHDTYPKCAPLDFENFAIVDDLPVFLLDHRRRFANFFYFTDPLDGPRSS